MVWHGDSMLPASDLIVLPGGFSYGDYLRCGAMAAHSPVMREVVARARAGTPGARHLQRLPDPDRGGAAARRADAQRHAQIRLPRRETARRANESIFTRRYQRGEVVRFPIAHDDGNYFADDATLERLEGEGRVAFRYCEPGGAITAQANPNGSRNNIAGIFNETGTVLGLMPHPERLADVALSGTDGAKLFLALVETLH